MKHLKTFTNIFKRKNQTQFTNISDFKKGDYVILEQEDNKKLLIKLGAKVGKSNAYDNTFLYNVQEFIDVDTGILLQPHIYYNYNLNYFFFTINKSLKILWQGKNKKEAIEMFDIIDTTNKYNL